MHKQGAENADGCGYGRTRRAELCPSMPIYEYRCEACGTRFSVLFWPPEEPRPRCRRCGSTKASRLVSRVALLRGEEDRLERLAEKAAGIDEADEAGFERWAREVERELGEELPGGAADDGADAEGGL